MQKVLSLYFKHANDALRSTSQTYATALTRMGYEVAIIDLSMPDSGARLAQALTSGEVDFCYGIQGVGSNLETGDNINVWTAHRTPFLCIHFDNPCYNPYNHFSDSPYVANMYAFESFLDIRQRYLPGNQLSIATPFQLPSIWTPQSIEHVVPFSTRTFRIVYLKSGGSLTEHEAYIDSLPPTLRDGIRQQLERAFIDPNLQLCDLVDKVFTAAGLDRRKQEKQFWGIAQTMDDYLRRKRAITFVEWLKFQEGAVIVGNGWDFIDKTAAKAIFQSGISIDEIGLYGLQTQFFANTNPYGRDIIHERILTGLMSSCVTLSDTNMWLDKNLAHTPALARFDWARPLDEQLQPVLQDPNAAAHAYMGPQIVYDMFIKGATAQPLIDLAQKVRQFAGG